jgi:hypothetical protein
MNPRRWLDRFQENRRHRPEPDWAQPFTLPEPQRRAVVRSLEQFQLGDGGGPASLIAPDAGEFRDRSAELRAVVDLWFAEEYEHSRLLGAAVARFGGRPIRRHWSFSAFCLSRCALGVRFELTVLLLTELVSTAYYRLLRRHCPDAPLRQACALILRDEAGHVAFHRDRLAAEPGIRRRLAGAWWRARFRLLGYAAATMLWVNHRAAIRALGGTDGEFYGEVRLELGRFLRRLRRAVHGPAAAPAAVLTALPPATPVAVV